MKPKVTSTYFPVSTLLTSSEGHVILSEPLHSSCAENIFCHQVLLSSQPLEKQRRLWMVTRLTDLILEFQSMRVSTFSRTNGLPGLVSISPFLHEHFPCFLVFGVDWNILLELQAGLSPPSCPHLEWLWSGTLLPGWSLASLQKAGLELHDYHAVGD